MKTKHKLYPIGSFCIELTDKQGIDMFDLLDNKKIPFYYIYDCTYTGGAVKVNCEHNEPEVVLELSDTNSNWLASCDHLKKSKDEIFVELITPDNPDDRKPMPEFDDIFKATDENLEKWKDGNIEGINTPSFYFRGE